MRIGAALQWVVGDLARHESAGYGAKLRLAEELGMPPSTLHNLASVCRRVAPERRRPELSFAHHAAVAPLEPEEQARRLADAAARRLSVRELRRELAHGRNAAGDDSVVSRGDATAGAHELLEQVRLQITVGADRAGAWRHAADRSQTSLSELAAAALDQVAGLAAHIDAAEIAEATSPDGMIRVHYVRAGHRKPEHRDVGGPAALEQLARLPRRARLLRIDPLPAVEAGNDHRARQDGTDAE